ncbi:DoxX family protein [Georgenia yuyongxinii]|uniref:DoxX family protein n=1 Tax=Georgenia yuyongxinii TaxID=2589797 RepID=A0A552WP83_9MICO|nr:DoxX family protein [Georgenia yuyongxinii]TRW44527.1 DoxX family protein [Georgenia yuyongxinii]
MVGLTDAGLLALRSGVGGVLIAHGCQKLFGWFGGHGLKGTGGYFESIGFAPGIANAVAAGVGEAGGGVCLVLGLGTPLAGAAASGTMIAATAVHYPSGFFAQKGGYEYAALLGLSSAALALTGPGEWSLDRALGHRFNQPWMSIAGLVGSIAGAGVILQRRARAQAAASSTPPAPATPEPEPGREP